MRQACKMRRCSRVEAERRLLGAARKEERRKEERSADRGLWVLGDDGAFEPPRGDTAPWVLSSFPVGERVAFRFDGERLLVATIVGCLRAAANRGTALYRAVDAASQAWQVDLLASELAEARKDVRKYDAACRRRRKSAGDDADADDAPAKRRRKSAGFVAPPSAAAAAAEVAAFLASSRPARAWAPGERCWARFQRASQEWYGGFVVGVRGAELECVFDDGEVLLVEARSSFRALPSAWLQALKLTAPEARARQLLRAKGLGDSLDAHLARSKPPSKKRPAPQADCCPVCYEALDEHAEVFGCSHRACSACTAKMTAVEVDRSIGTRRGVFVKCPLCRHRARRRVGGSDDEDDE
ncbi:hypothetical protein M885DRAFT_496397 [Pelagophyceae sp. CCMP2097]|nr:hypothetical protein M885DRAFT_496397 [Pelagophyceae sp. CCMP2097]